MKAKFLEMDVSDLCFPEIILYCKIQEHAFLVNLLYTYLYCRPCEFSLYSLYHFNQNILKQEENNHLIEL